MCPPCKSEHIRRRRYTHKWGALLLLYTTAPRRSRKGAEKMKNTTVDTSTTQAELINSVSGLSAEGHASFIRYLVCLKTMERDPDNATANETNAAFQAELEARTLTPEREKRYLSALEKALGLC